MNFGVEPEDDLDEPCAAAEAEAEDDDAVLVMDTVTTAGPESSAAEAAGELLALALRVATACVVVVD